GEDIVIGGARYGEMVELGKRLAPRAWHVGDEHDMTAGLAEADKRLAGGVIGADAIMHDTPDIAEDEAVIGDDVGEPRNQGWTQGIRHAVRLLLRRAGVKRGLALPLHSWPGPGTLSLP